MSNISLSILLVLINKHIVIFDKFDFMIVLSGLHFYSSFMSCSLFLVLGFMKYRYVHDYSSVIKISAGSLLSIIFMNYSLAKNSVGFYQISKLFCIPITLLLETILNCRQQELSFQLLCSLGLILIGMVMVVEQEIRVNPQGIIWTALGVLSTSFAQIFFGPLQKKLGLDAMQLLLHTSPILTFGSFLSIPMFENISNLINFKIQKTFIISTLISCCTAVAFNVSNYLVLGKISPLSYTVLGQFKTILIILIGSYLFDNIPSKKMIVGISFGLVGVICYTLESRRQQQQKPAQSSPKPIIPTIGIHSMIIDKASHDPLQELVHANIEHPKSVHETVEV